MKKLSVFAGCLLLAGAAVVCQALVAVPAAQLVMLG